MREVLADGFPQASQESLCNTGHQCTQPNYSANLSSEGPLANDFIPSSLNVAGKDHLIVALGGRQASTGDNMALNPRYLGIEPLAGFRGKRLG
jgi:hypothetical protein